MCTACKGEETIEEREIVVIIEPGVPKNHIVRFNGKGNISPDGTNRGDLVFTEKVSKQSNDRVFTRVDDDLHITQVITLKELLTGYQNKTICTHMDGQVWSASQPFGSVTNPDHVLKLADGGMPLYQSMTGARGDLYVHFECNFPQQLNIPDDSPLKDLLCIALENDEERTERTSERNDVTLSGNDDSDEVILQCSSSLTHYETVLGHEKNQLPSNDPPSPYIRSSTGDTSKTFVKYRSSPHFISIGQSMKLLTGCIVEVSDDATDEDSDDATDEDSDDAKEESSGAMKNSDATSKESDITGEDNSYTRENTNDASEESNVTSEVSNNTTEKKMIQQEPVVIQWRV